VIAVAGFIARQEQFVDEIGFVTTRTAAKKSKRKQDRNGKVVAQSTRDITWKFVEKSKHTALYRDYFNLSLPVECKMMTLSSQASTPLLRGHLSDHTLSCQGHFVPDTSLGMGSLPDLYDCLDTVTDSSLSSAGLQRLAQRTQFYLLFLDQSTRLRPPPL
jgi:hypothetical protein